MHPRFSGENIEKNKVIYARLSDLASKHAYTPPQLALAWLLHQGEDVIPIPGTAFKITIIIDFIRDRLHYKIDVQHHITCGSFNEDTSMM